MAYSGTYVGTVHTYCDEFNDLYQIRFTINENGYIDLPSSYSLNDGTIDSAGRISGISITVNSLSLGRITIPYTATDDGTNFYGTGRSSNGIISTIRGTLLRDNLNGSDDNDVLTGTSGSDVLLAYGGNDIMTGGGGDDTLYGGSGVDTAVFSGARAQYRIRGDENRVTVTDLVSGRDGVDLALNVERLKFADTTLVTKYADERFTADSMKITAPAGQNSVYRFYDTNTGDHFYTTSAYEKLQIFQTIPHFNYEGAAWATPNKSAATQDVFRFLDSGTGTHFYTTSVHERDQVIATAPSYHYEGIAFQAYTSESAAGSGALVLERFYNTQTGLHHFAANAQEAYGINHGAAGPGWVDEGRGFVVHAPTDGMLVV